MNDARTLQIRLSSCTDESEILSNEDLPMHFSFSHNVYIVLKGGQRFNSFFYGICSQNIKFVLYIQPHLPISPLAF